MHKQLLKTANCKWPTCNYAGYNDGELIVQNHTKLYEVIQTGNKTYYFTWGISKKVLLLNKKKGLGVVTDILNMTMSLFSFCQLCVWWSDCFIN